MRSCGWLMGSLAALVCTPLHAQQTAVAPDPFATSDARVVELQKKAKAIVDAHSDFEPVYAHDGKHVVFASNRDRLAQIYVASLDKPNEAPRRLTQTTERTIGPMPLADGRRVLYRSDRGADENWSIYTVALDGGAPVNLTPGETLQRDGPIVPDSAPDTMFYSARRISDPESSLYSQTIAADSKPRRIYTDKAPGALSDVSADGKQALWARFPSVSETHILLVDLQTGAARELYPGPQRKERIENAIFSADGKRIVITTDEGGEGAVLLALDLSGKQLARYTERNPTTALLASVCPSRKDDRLAVTVVAGDHSEIRLLDAASLQPVATVKLPVGSGGTAVCPNAFAPDDRRLLVAWSTPQAPTDLYSINTASGEATRLLPQPRSGLDGLPAINARVVEIKAFDGGRIPMLVYLPAGANGKLPVIVSYHGGPASVSTARWSPQIRYYTALGYAYVEPNVRGSSGYGRAFEEGDNGRKRLDAFKDIETSARWVASQPWADSNRMVIFGGSYGGYTTLIGMTRQPEIWRAGVNLFGVVDLRTFLETTSGVIRDLFKLEFGELGKDDAFLASISPIHDVQKIVDPMFVYAGANDPRVPRSESDMIVAAARKKGVPVEYMVKDDEGHSLSKKANQIEFLARSARFLEKHLALSGT